MKKPVFPRILLLLLLYCAIFILLVSVQFAKRGGFTQKVGNFIVTGQYRMPEGDEPPRAPNEYLLDGDMHLFFGGIDFGMISGDEGQSFSILGEDGAREEMLPERMLINGDSVLFTFAGGTELEYSTHYSGGALEMRISGSFPEGITGAELPFRLMRKTGIRDAGDGQIIISSDGVNYSFGRTPMDAEKRMLLIASDGVAVSYRAIPEQKALSPDDFILPRAESADAYGEALTKWRDQNFSLWNRTIREQNNEDTVIAFAGEAVVRGTYRAAVAAVPAAFLRGTSRTYESSVYLGSLGEAYRSLVSREQEKIARLSRQINEKSLEFLKEPHVFAFFAVRGQGNFIDAGAELVRTIDPAILALDITPGILEGYLDWKTWRPGTENPFERLADQACFVINNSLMKTGTAADNAGEPWRVFSFADGRGDTEFNLRLGKALLNYAESAEDSSMTGIGRSLILSSLSMGDASGAVKGGLVISENGEIIEGPVSQGLTTARLYRILSPVGTLPGARVIGATQNGIWAWTAALSINSVQQNDVLDITVNFPAGETHFMMIRGLRPFARIQLYGMDFRSDPQFERYDSSGWVYYPQDQILVLKMRHRTADERIRIIFREEPRPAAQPAAAPPPADAPQPAAAASENNSSAGENNNTRAESIER